MLIPKNPLIHHKGRFVSTKSVQGTIMERFYERFIPEPNSGCWLWVLQGKNGYGSFRIDNLSRSAHRVSWELHNGDIPSGMMVLHKCDIRCCVNPQHLYLGTHKDNMNDMKVRKRCHGRRGEESELSKITEKDAVEIFNASGLHKDIAKKYGVSRENVGLIKRGKTWSHVNTKEQAS